MLPLKGKALTLPPRAPRPQLQYHARGPSGRATVNADMYKDGKEWR